MPVFNGEKYIAAALDSVGKQVTKEIEVIVVDDGSSDSTLEIVDRFTGKLPLRVVTHGRSGNWTAASNLGLREAKGEWACFLHHDDVWLPGRMARILPELRNSELSLVLHNAIFIGPDGESLGRWTCPLHEGNVSPKQLLEQLLVQNFIAMPCPVFRTDLAIRTGGLDESLWHSADWDLWLRLGAAGSTLFINETLAGFRIHPTSQTAARPTTPGEWQRQLRAVFDRHLPGWAVAGKRRRSVERLAAVSIAVNSALSDRSRGEFAAFFPVLVQLARLGPLGGAEYFRRSRILQRVVARLRVRQGSPPSSGKEPKTGLNPFLAMICGLVLRKVMLPWKP